MNASWNSTLISSLFDVNSAREIHKIAISHIPRLDYPWTHSPSGKFSFSSAYRFISSQRVSSFSTPLDPNQWKLLWKLKLNARLKLLLWKIAWDLLPSKTRLNTIFPIPVADSLCPLFSMEEDSLHHLFLRCSFARIAWTSSFWLMWYL
jgi:hypothetical protein